MGNSKSIDGEYGRTLEVQAMPHPNDKGRIYLGIREGFGLLSNIIVPIADLAQALSGLEIEGLEAAYDPPKPHAPAPTGIGAVVKSKMGMLITRVADNKWHTDGDSQVRFSDEHVENWLNNGQVTIITEGVQP